MPVWILAFLEKLSKVAPACLFGIVLMGGGIITYSLQNFASARDMEDLSKSIDKNFNVLMTRMNLSDAERVVQDMLNQIRQKEKEIADLEIVLAELDTKDPRSDAATVLRNRVFGLKQDLSDLRGRLVDENRDMQRARDAVRAASGP